MKSWLGIRKKTIAMMMIVMLIFTMAFSTDTSRVKAETSTNEESTVGELEEFINVSIESASDGYTSDNTSVVKEDVNGADFTITRNGSSNTLDYGSGSVSSTGWDSDPAYWEISFSTKGYEEINVAYNQRSSKTGPAKFGVQYSIDGTNFTTMEGISYTVDKSLSEYAGTISLPDELADQEMIYLRIVADADGGTVGGATSIPSTGVSNINDIVVSGTPASLEDGFYATVSSDPVSESQVTIDDCISYTVNSAKVISGGAVVLEPAADEVSLSYSVAGRQYQEYDQTNGIAVSDIAEKGEDIQVSVLATYENWCVEKQFSYTVQGDVTAISTVREASEGEFTVGGYVTFVSGKSVYIQDTTGGICIYCSTTPSDVAVGNYITATGTKTTYNGLEELKSAEIDSNDQESHELESTKITDLAEFKTNYDQYEATLVSFENVILTSISATGTSVISDEDGNTLNIYSAGTTALADLSENNIVNVTAVVDDSNGLRLRIGDAGSITFVSEGQAEEEEPDEEDTVTDPISDDMITNASAININDVVSSTTGDTVTTVGQVTYMYGNNGTLNTIVIQDVIDGEIVGLQLYSSSAVSECEVGDIVCVTGTVSTYGSVVQLNPVSDVTILSQDVEKFEPQELTIEELLVGGDDYVSEYVVVKDVTLGTYSSSNTAITDATGTINIYKAATFGDDISAGDTVDAYGVFSKYNTTYQMRNGTTATSYKTEGTVTVDDSITLPLVSWAGTATESFTGTTVYGDLNSDNDQLDTTAEFTNSINSIPQSEANGTYYLGSTGLAAGDYMQMAFSTIGYGSLNLSFSIRCSNSGPAKFNIYYSTDGKNYTKCSGFDYSITETQYASDGTSSNVTTDYDSVDYIVATTTLHDYTISLPAALNHQEKVYVRVQVADDSTSVKGGTIGTGGTIRFINVEYTASPVVSDDLCGIVQITPDAGAVALNTELTMTSATDGAVLYYSIDGGEYQEYDSSKKPVLTTLPATVTTYATKDGIEDSVKVTYAYTQAQVAQIKCSPNGGAVNLDTKVKLTSATEGATIYYSLDDGETWTNYTEAITLSSLPTNIMAKATLSNYLDSAESTFKFTLRENEEYNLYFGQIHSHTSYSDGAGTCEDAFEYASTEAEHIDFLAVTDHSNLFDNDTDVSITDGSASSEWEEGQALADEYTTDTFVGIMGYEMTWSGGAPGHMNTFNTSGFMSRNMTGYGNGSTSSLSNYYETLKTVTDSISQFNHPGTTFGDFYDFGYYDEEIDNLITVIEVGNGEGAIGSSGYFPSYEYYTRALDKGWHVAPTNNQDNHKGKWGDANTGRTVVLADSLTRDNIYDALRNMRTYATEDNDLNIYYTLNGSDMGTIFEETPDEVDIKVQLSDETDESIGTVEVIVNGGLSIASETVSGNEGTVEFTLDPTYSYYYIRVTEADGDIAVTAPVWISDVEAVGVSSLTTDASLEVSGEPINLTATLYNNEEDDFNVDSIVYTVNSQVVHQTDVASAGLSVIKSQATATDTFEYTYDGLGTAEITVTVIGTLNGVSKTYTSTLRLTYVDTSMVTRVVIDGTHNNDYVTGYYGGNVGNFADIAADDYVQVNVVTDEITAETLEDCALLVLSAPAKKTGTYNSETYSTSTFSDEFIQVVKDYVGAGGNVIFCGLADYSDSTEIQSSTEINKLLTAIGATMRLNSDEMVDDENNGGQTYRLYFDDFNMDSEYLDGVTSDQTYSAYSGASVLLDSDAVAAGTCQALVMGHDTTYSIDSKSYDSNYVEVEQGDIVALGHETLTSGSEIFLAGTVFISDFEVDSDLDNASDSYYANRNILLNILSEVKKELPITTIAEMRQGEEGDIYAIEGWVTAGTAVDGNTFFDTIYVQDETGGTTVFPIADEGIKIGTKLQIVGYVDGYQGDKEIQVVSYSILDDENLNVISPLEVTTEQAADYDTYGGSLLKVTGTVTEVVTNSAGVDYFYVKDSSGVEARIFIDGYILASDGDDTVNEDVQVGNVISAIGLSYMNPDGACLRVRDRAEVELSETTNDSSSGSTGSSYISDSSSESGLVSNGDNSYEVDGSSQAWEDFGEKIDELIAGNETAEEENTIHVDLQLSNTTTVPQTVLESICGTDIELEIELKNGVVVTINGSNLNSEEISTIGTVDFGVTLNADKIPADTISTLLGTAEEESQENNMQISLAHNGSFGGTVQMTFDLSDLVKDQETSVSKLRAAIYYYTDGQLVLQSVSKISDAGKAQFAFQHASDYVIVVSDSVTIDETTLSSILWNKKTSDETGTTTLKLGTKTKTKQLTMTYPDVLQTAIESGALDAKVKYSTSDKSVVVVSKAGKLTAKKKGSATITATVTIGDSTLTFTRTVKVKKASK